MPDLAGILLWSATILAFIGMIAFESYLLAWWCLVAFIITAMYELYAIRRKLKK